MFSLLAPYQKPESLCVPHSVRRWLDLPIPYLHCCFKVFTVFPIQRSLNEQRERCSGQSNLQLTYITLYAQEKDIRYWLWGFGAMPNTFIMFLINNHFPRATGENHHWPIVFRGWPTPLSKAAEKTWIPISGSFVTHAKYLHDVSWLNNHFIEPREWLALNNHVMQLAQITD